MYYYQPKFKCIYCDSEMPHVQELILRNVLTIRQSCEKTLIETLTKTRGKKSKVYQLGIWLNVLQSIVE